MGKDKEDELPMKIEGKQEHGGRMCCGKARSEIPHQCWERRARFPLGHQGPVLQPVPGTLGKV